MASKAAVRRLQTEYRNILKDPVDHIQAHPNPNNILEWHFAMEGPSDTHFAGGIYHGKILFPADYPFKPPDVYFVTPNGKFKTDYALCFSFTTYHSESWNPMWSVATILGGVLSFMTDDVAHTTGSMKVSSTEKRRLARHSMEWNSNNPAFRRHFPDLVDKYHEARAKEAIQKQHRQEVGAPQEDSGVDGASSRASQKPSTKPSVLQFVYNMAIMLTLAVLLAIPLLQADKTAKRLPDGDIVGRILRQLKLI